MNDETIKATTVLLDTNLWLDYIFPYRENHRYAFALVDRLADSAIYELLYFAGSIKDVYYIFTNDNKRLIHQSGNSIDENTAYAINQTAWSNIDLVTQLASPLPLDDRTIWMARQFKPFCPDFEDCLVLAACKLANVDYLVTNDKGLTNASPFATLTASQALEYLDL